MIHQCYFAEPQRARLFTSPVYRGFGLYTAVNPDIARNCPELEDPKNQPMLSEYAAMLHLWRNPELDPDPWIGFTSYRQLDKFPTIFNSREEVETQLQQFDVVGWGGYPFLDAPTGRPISLAEASERMHIGIVSCLWKMMMLRNETMPQNFVATNVGLFCNYWVMSRRNFNEYMEWSYPLVRWCLTNPDPYIQSHPRSLSYMVERLFILWYAAKNKRATHVGQLGTMPSYNPFYVPGATEKADASERYMTLSDWHVTLKELCDRHRVKPRGIIHIGAHYAEERDVYQSMGVENVLWIEADPNNIPQLKINIAAFPGHRAIQACISSEDGKQTPFFRTNNAGESSSMLPMGTHKEKFRDIHVTEQTTLETVTFGKLVGDAEIDLAKYDFLVMDIQGAELLALRGFGDLLHRFNGAYLEVNVEPLYQGCALIGEIDEFFSAEGLSRRETLITQRQYGDALYLRDSVFAAPPLDELAQRTRKARAQLVLERNFTYRLSGHGERPIELLETGQVGQGKGQLEQLWLVRPGGYDVVLEFVGVHGRTCSLRQAADGVWRGQLLFQSFVPIELVPPGNRA